MMFFYLQIKVLVYKVTEHLSFKFTTKVLLWHSSLHSLFNSTSEHRIWRPGNQNSILCPTPDETKDGHLSQCYIYLTFIISY